MVVEDRRAAGEGELCQPRPRGGVLRLRVESRPHGVELAEPRKESGLLGAGPRQRLAQMVMGVDEPRRDDGATEVDALDLVRTDGLRAGPDGDDDAVLDEHPAVRMLGGGVVHGDDPAVRVERPHAAGRYRPAS